jgi:hypothetical protein
MEMPLAYQRQPDEDEKIWYHASPRPFDISEIRPMSHFGTNKAARGRAASKSKTRTSKHIRSNVMAVRLKLRNGWKIHDDEGDHSPRDIVDMLHSHDHISDQEYQQLTSKVALPAADRPKGYQHIADFLHSKGVDHLHYINAVEDEGTKSVIVVDPKKTIRPVFQSKTARVNFKRGLYSYVP